MVLPRVRKSKITSVCGMVVTFKVLNQKKKKLEEVNISQLVWYLLGVENCSDHAHNKEFWNLLGVLFKIVTITPSPLYGRPTPVLPHPLSKQKGIYILLTRLYQDLSQSFPLRGESRIGVR